MKRNPRGRGWWRLAPPLALVVLTLLGVNAWPHDAARPRRLIVEIRGMAFQPAVLELNRGDTVVWINRDFVPHTATAEQKPAWTTGSLTQDQQGQFVARRTGEIPYFCELHPVMKGTLIVR